MKYNIRNTAIILFSCIIWLSSCKKYLDQVPNDRITMDEVFQKETLSEQFLANVYS